ncbi:uncharacterized protein LOC130807059 [Amaranthus tricolor]|uniref:uncharacterized protein LOC130807059 n=1 Tax=Amaranthus tricolor TaxID=29722 RepID=UPI00258FA79B|nr:uncharacterized protein LOC130807059 [Amaranthus tricolor]
MEAIDDANPTTREWLVDIGDQTRWTKYAFDPNVCCDENKTNFVESFNATLGVDRCKCVLTLLEGIRRVTMVRMATRKKKSENWINTDFCPNIVKRVKSLISDSRKCKAFNSADGFYEIKDGKSTLSVSLNDRTCMCNAWQLTGIPCKHAVRVILHSSQDPIRFCNDWYSCKMYKQVYASTIRSIPDPEHWPKMQFPLIKSPMMKRAIGRPAKNRKREADEE